MNFLSTLRKRNPLLYWFGWYNIIAGIVCMVLLQLDFVQILGISRWVKPMKFFFSIAIMSWTMGWLMYYLKRQKAVRVCSWLIVISMFVENFIITLQSARETASHFNTSSALNGMLFSIMGLFIVAFTVTVIYITVLYFRQKQFNLPGSYLWGIRLGLVLFIIFSVEGGMMVSRLSHTVGGPDGGPGLPIVNWSTVYGDLRVAHFLGMHALQIMPLAGFYIIKTKRGIIAFAILYGLLVSAMFILALRGVPVFG